MPQIVAPHDPLLLLVTRVLTLVANAYAAFRAAKGEQRVFARGVPVEPLPQSAQSSGPQPSPDAVNGSWRAQHSALAAGHTGGCPARGYSRSLPEAHTADANASVVCRCTGRLQRLVRLTCLEPYEAWLLLGPGTLRPVGTWRAVFAGKAHLPHHATLGIGVWEPGDDSACPSGT